MSIRTQRLGSRCGELPSSSASIPIEILDKHPSDGITSTVPTLGMTQTIFVKSKANLSYSLSSTQTKPRPSHSAEIVTSSIPQPKLNKTNSNSIENVNSRVTRNNSLVQKLTSPTRRSPPIGVTHQYLSKPIVPKPQPTIDESRIGKKKIDKLSKMKPGPPTKPTRKYEDAAALSTALKNRVSSRDIHQQVPLCSADQRITIHSANQNAELAIYSPKRQSGSQVIVKNRVQNVKILAHKENSNLQQQQQQQRRRQYATSSECQYKNLPYADDYNIELDSIKDSNESRPIPLSNEFPSTQVPTFGSASHDKAPQNLQHRSSISASKLTPSHRYNTYSHNPLEHYHSHSLQRKANTPSPPRVAFDPVVRHPRQYHRETQKSSDNFFSLSPTQNKRFLNSSTNCSIPDSQTETLTYGTTIVASSTRLQNPLSVYRRPPNTTNQNKTTQKIGNTTCMAAVELHHPTSTTINHYVNINAKQSQLLSQTFNKKQSVQPPSPLKESHVRILSHVNCSRNLQQPYSPLRPQINDNNRSVDRTSMYDCNDNNRNVLNKNDRNPKDSPVISFQPAQGFVPQQRNLLPYPSAASISLHHTSKFSQKILNTNSELMELERHLLPNYNNDNNSNSTSAFLENRQQPQLHKHTSTNQLIHDVEQKQKEKTNEIVEIDHSCHASEYHQPRPTTHFAASPNFTQTTPSYPLQLYYKIPGSDLFAPLMIPQPVYATADNLNYTHGSQTNMFKTTPSPDDHFYTVHSQPRQQVDSANGSAVQNNPFHYMIQPKLQLEEQRQKQQQTSNNSNQHTHHTIQQQQQQDVVNDVLNNRMPFASPVVLRNNPLINHLAPQPGGLKRPLSGCSFHQHKYPTEVMKVCAQEDDLYSENVENEDGEFDFINKTNESEKDEGSSCPLRKSPKRFVLRPSGQPRSSEATSPMQSEISSPYHH